MKKLSILILGLLASVGMSAQQETLFGNVDVWGGFGGPIFEISSIADESIVSVGGGGALIMDNFFFGGYGIGTDDANYSFEEQDYRVKYNHGGLWFGVTSNPNKLIHIYGSTRVGWGKARLRQDGDTIFSDRIFTVTPELGFEVNVTRFFQLAVTGGYRVNTGINDLPGLTNADFSNLVGGITLRFGGFGGDDDDWDW
jgi:hypothetical protein